MADLEKRSSDVVVPQGTELPRLSMATPKQIRGINIRKERMQTDEGRARLLGEARGVLESIARWSAPPNTDFIDERYGTALPENHWSHSSVLAAAEELTTAAHDVESHVAEVQDGLTAPRQDFDRMWLRVEIAVDALSSAANERKELHQSAREPYMKKLSAADRQRFYRESLTGITDSLKHVEKGLSRDS